jgi:hypothetical protein
LDLKTGLPVFPFAGLGWQHISPLTVFWGRNVKLPGRLHRPPGCNPTTFWLLQPFHCSTHLKMSGLLIKVYPSPLAKDAASFFNRDWGQIFQSFSIDETLKYPSGF